jgi:hypothetical protein
LPPYTSKFTLRALLVPLFGQFHETVRKGLMEE